MFEFGVEWFEDQRKHDTGKNGAEWASLHKAFLLKEGAVGAIGATEPAKVGIPVELVIEWKEWSKSGMTCQNGMTSVL